MRIAYHLLRLLPEPFKEFMTSNLCLGIGFGLFFNVSSAVGIELDLPVRCEMGKTCFIQNYFDHQSGRGYADYRCGHLSYDNHKGTDFRVIDELAMNRGVVVVAAADGYVLAVRNGEPDIPVSVNGKDRVTNKEAGNGVVIEHGDGWQTQYSHLKNNSLSVKKGDWVYRGQPIGQIGESGEADFPHVELAVRKDGKPMDPFWPFDLWSCNSAPPENNLWSKSARKSLFYVDTTILQTGFAEQIPTRIQSQTGRWNKTHIRSDAPQFVMWTEIMGAKDGDEWRIQISDPSGQKLVNTEGKILGNKAVAVIGAGKRLRAGFAWPTGTYNGVFILSRQGKPYLKNHAILQID